MKKQPFLSTAILNINPVAKAGTSTSEYPTAPAEYNVSTHDRPGPRLAGILAAKYWNS